MTMASLNFFPFLRQGLIASLLFQHAISWSTATYTKTLKIQCFQDISRFDASQKLHVRTWTGLHSVDGPNNLNSVNNDGDDDEVPLPFRRALLASTLAAGTELVFSQYFVRPGFRRLRPTQFIAALGDPQSSEGVGAEKWGVWERDPGPRGIPFDRFADFLDEKKNGAGSTILAPTGWEIDAKDFWLEEHGIWMETPRYDILPAGRYLVTGGRSRTSVLRIFPEDERGEKRWSLDGGVLYDVTHLPCRSARYIKEDIEGEGSPIKARKEDFPVRPGAEMPMVEGCRKQDYAVLFVTGIEAQVAKSNPPL